MLSRYVMSQVKHNGYFAAGMCLGLWLALALVPLEPEGATCAAALGPAPAAEAGDFEPHREERPLPPAGAAAARAVQRPRYYSTELGMRGSLLTGVLSSAGALRGQVAALNRTLARLQPALKFFITASAMSDVPGLANVVGFTDTREVLKPFHALKYLADNYLEEYDFFFLITDESFVHARRLTDLVSRLSVSQDVYMGVPGSEEPAYCALEAGVLLSNSVLRALHAELEWCVRNSYSPRHHENLGRCVLHAAHTPCTDTLQGETFRSLVLERADGGDARAAALAGAVSARPAGPAALAALHALSARAALAAGGRSARALAGSLARAAARHPPHYRNVSWPAGLRAEPGLAPPPPDSRFSHVRWTLFNSSHAFMPDELRAVAPHDAAHKQALELVMEHVQAWCARRWGGAEGGEGGARVTLVEGARRWDPPTALSYRLVLRVQRAGRASYRQLEVSRPLGAARLVPVRYVTESARLTLVLPVPPPNAPDALAALARIDRVALRQDKNTDLVVVWVEAGNSSAEPRAPAALAGAVAALGARARVLAARAAQDVSALSPEPARLAAAARAALAALPLPPDSLLLLIPPHLDFNQDFLNRARMNCIAGVSWFLPLPFARHAQFAHPAFRATTGTGRFGARPRAPLLAAYKHDLDEALAARPGADAEAALAAHSIRCVRAAEPGAVLQPRPPPCPAGAGAAACLRALGRDRFERLDLGARNLLAQLHLETQAQAQTA